MASLAEQIIQFRVAGLSAVQAAIARVGGALRGMGSFATGIFSRFGSAISSVISPMSIMQGMGIGIGMSIASGIGSAIRSAIGLAAQVENLSTSFRVLLGSSTAAKTMMDQINKFAAETPFEQMELADVAKQLLAYGTAANDIIPTMRRLGDIAALSGANLGDLAAIYGKVQAQGKLTAETLEGWQSRGIPITRELAAIFGVAESQVRELVSQGAVGFPQVQEAIRRLTEEGGQFAGGMQQLSQTTGGLWSTVTGNLKTALAEFGAQIIELFNIRGILANVGTWLDSLSGWIKGFFAEWGPIISQAISATMSYFQAMWEMISEIAAAVGNVLGSLLGGLSEINLAEALANYFADLQFFFENWRLMLAYTWEYWKLVVTNLWERIKTFFVNAWNVVSWFFQNWQDIALTGANFIATVFQNLGENLKSIWRAVLDYIKGKGWHVDWTPLTEGFQSAIREMPEMTEAAIAETTPELERLKEEMFRSRAAFDEARAREQAEREKAKKEGPPPLPGAAPAAAGGALAAAGGGREARLQFIGFAELARSMQQRAIEEFQKRQAEAAKRTADGVTKLASAVEGDSLKVKLADPVQAVYG